MQYKEVFRTTGLIILSLTSTILIYFALEPLTNYFREEGYVGLSIISNATIAIIIFFLVLWFNKKVNGLESNDYGFGSNGIIKKFFSGVTVTIFLVFLIILTASFFTDIRIDFVDLNNGISFIEFIMANLVVAAWEEMYFRGLVVNTLLKRNVSFKWTAVISSGLFTVAHATSYDMATTTSFWIIGVFFISTILLLLYVLTRSIWTSIGCHFFWDSLFMSLDKRENNFGIIQMKMYLQNSILIDNISILITGVALVLFFIVMRNRINSLVQLYISNCSYLQNRGIQN